MNTSTITVSEQSITGLRVDRYLAENHGLFSRSQLKARNAKIAVNGKSVKISHKIKYGDIIQLELESLPDLSVEAEEIPLDILFQNSDVVVINKPQGLVVHPGPGNYSHTLVNALLFLAKDLKIRFPKETVRPGIVHRLDKDTSGILITALNTASLEALAEQFRNKSVKKKYVALVHGVPKISHGKIDTLISRDQKNRKAFSVSSTAGKRSITYYKVLKTFGCYSLILLKPKTGRTHQLRVHMKFLGCPILGDPIYGRNSQLDKGKTLMLHAYSLVIKLPDEDEARKFIAPIPERIKKLLKSLNM